MSDSENKLPPLPDEAFDGEKYSVEVKTSKCNHDVTLKDNKIICKQCGAIWQGPQLARLYEAFTRQKTGQKSN